MPMIPAKLKQDIESALKAAFQTEFKDEIKANDQATKSHEKLAKAISSIADVIVLHITTNAQVTAGIPVATAGSPAAQTGVTTAPGLIS